MNFLPYLLTGIGGLAIMWYYFCLIYLGFYRPAPPANADSFRQFMTFSLTSLGGTLATFVGMLLGLQTAPAQSGAAEATQALQQTPLSALQMAAAVLYVLSLVIALVAWGKHKDNPDPAIVGLGKSLAGLFGGVLAVGLNIVPR